MTVPTNMKSGMVLTVPTDMKSGMGMMASPLFVIAAQAAIHLPPDPQSQGWEMDPRLRGDDGVSFEGVGA
ncbi:hypothetical protein [Sphingobium sp. Leaf26]|uniref:hypothetical protein n=1 Tax=Sphingobium sp. Leaf26 TaxID=1735693 RepID=UPI000AB2CD94|nr:hypothetical protein [Sphingobium sp. Leaf26]